MFKFSTLPNAEGKSVPILSATKSESSFANCYQKSAVFLGVYLAQSVCRDSQEPIYVRTWTQGLESCTQFAGVQITSESDDRIGVMCSCFVDLGTNCAAIFNIYWIHLRTVMGRLACRELNNLILMSQSCEQEWQASAEIYLHGSNTANLVEVCFTAISYVIIHFYNYCQGLTNVSCIICWGDVTFVDF